MHLYVSTPIFLIVSALLETWVKLAEGFPSLEIQNPAPQAISAAKKGKSKLSHPKTYGKVYNWASIPLVRRELASASKATLQCWMKIAQ